MIPQSHSWDLSQRNENLSLHKNYLLMFIVALFIIAPTGNNPNVLPQVNIKLLYTHTMEY